MATTRPTRWCLMLVLSGLVPAVASAAPAEPAPAEPAPAEPAPAEPAPAEPAPAEPAPAEPAPTEPAPKPDAPKADAPKADPNDASGWGGDFGGGDAEGDEDDGDDEFADDEASEGAAFAQSSGRLVTIPGERRIRTPPFRVGHSGFPRHSLVYKNLTALRYNALGLVNENSMGYRLQLFDKDSKILSDSYFGAKVHTWITPAYARIGPMIEFQPAALLNLSARYEYTGYYSTFGLMQSFPSATSDYGDDVIDRLEADGTHYATRGHFVTLSALLQAKVGPIAVRDNVQFYWADYKLRDGDRVFYSQLLDILQGNRGWAVTNDADLIWLVNSKLKLAGRYSVAYAFYREEHFLPIEPILRKVNGPTHRVGPGVLYTFFDRPYQRFNKPTVLLLAQWWIQHRYRTGQEVSQAIPQVVLGFTFDGQLLPDPSRGRTRPARRAADDDKKKKKRKSKGKESAG